MVDWFFLPMLLKDISFNSPEDNILFDEVLLAQAEQQGSDDVLRLWESPAVFIVLGRTGQVDEEIDRPAVITDRVPVLRRFSGGGTVVQGPGCFNFSFILSRERDPRLADLRQSYVIILSRVTELLDSLGVRAVVKPISDIALREGERKISGNAQHRGRRYLLHHGTLLCQFDLNLLARYLRIPREVPEYRQGRGHLDFVANIDQSVATLRSVFLDHFHPRKVSSSLSAAEQSALASLRRDKPVRLNIEEG